MVAMASITIRNLDDETKERLRVRAAHHRRSMEEKARSILREALEADMRLPRDLAGSIHERFAVVSGVDLDIPAREPMREPPEPDT
jgi:antitoxin FitA